MSLHRRLAPIATSAAAGIAGLLPDGIALLGGSMIAWGAYRIYEPAGFVVGGALLLVIGMIGVVRRG